MTTEEGKRRDGDEPFSVPWLPWLAVRTQRPGAVAALQAVVDFSEAPAPEKAAIRAALENPVNVGLICEYLQPVLDQLAAFLTPVRELFPGVLPAPEGATVSAGMLAADYVVSGSTISRRGMAELRAWLVEALRASGPDGVSRAQIVAEKPLEEEPAQWAAAERASPFPAILRTSAPQRGPSRAADGELMDLPVAVPDPISSRAIRRLARSAWRDRIQPEIERVLSKAVAPSVPMGVWIGIRSLSQGELTVATVPGGVQVSLVEGQRVRTITPALDANTLPMVMRGLEVLGGFLGDRMLRYAVRTTWERFRANCPDARVLRFHGGEEGLRRSLGVSTHFRGELGAALRAGRDFTCTGGREVMGLWSWERLEDEAPGRPGVGLWTIGTVLAPGYRGTDRLLPIPADVNLDWAGPRVRGALGKLQWESIIELAQAAHESDPDGWIPMRGEAWKEAIDRAEVQISTAREAIDRWTKGEQNERWLEAQDERVRLLDPASRALLVQVGGNGKRRGGIVKKPRR